MIAEPAGPVPLTAILATSIAACHHGRGGEYAGQSPQVERKHKCAPRQQNSDQQADGFGDQRGEGGTDQPVFRNQRKHQRDTQDQDECSWITGRIGRSES